LIARENEENRNFGPTVTLEQALHLPLFLASPKQGVRRIVELTAKRHGMPPPNVIGDINSVSIMRSTLLVGLGYTLLPPMPFKQEIEQKLLKAWPIREPCLYRHVMIGALKGVPLTPATRAILQLARQVARQLSLSGEWLETSPIE
jgi:LysR family nitrogen assimilation transcriptional regulator